MKKYVGKRFLTAVPVLLMITIGAFIMINLAPGEPTDLYITPDATVQQVEATRRALGLDQPYPVQYIRWLGRAVTGDLGISFSTRYPVLPIIISRLGPTIVLMGTTLLFSYIVAIPLGIISARKQGTWVDTFLTGSAFVGVSIPNFFLGLGLIYIFAVQLNWFPTGGMQELGVDGSIFSVLRHLVLPVIVLSAFYIANMTRYMRATMIQVYGENYIRTATAKGLAQKVILTKHGIRNALIPVITIVGTDLPRLVGGAIVTEQIFQWPGLGRLTITAIQQRDLPILMAITILSAFVVLLANIFVDVMYAVVDPRIKYD
ncbi:ABC transporter permease [Alkalibacterium putridalgicola]|jgi:peptide/nickel transport system permease protein|uniref:Oligopeptide transport system permease protein AppB n=1 Tax=Alkalibacterium putridalgicola TaxID=426703 RepID=A0A1H7QY10_9LACT|nr:ABC transporter permease [Alkalibacterium putridalgicola]GEK88996.1 oligopeptide transport system permease protein AppB [Alkalibacterium putridalgicola]SEL52901.1 peptide/nickel transport system permease protein [Alkalibacterium putridalgicola]